MRRHVQDPAGVALALLVDDVLHAIAVGNPLPAAVLTVCVDINPSVVTKLLDWGSLQTAGLVIDAGGFLRSWRGSYESVNYCGFQIADCGFGDEEERIFLGTPSIRNLKSATAIEGR
ncbi:MAG: hypothetical protein U0232_32765 [Thermomicrobiales bacterium]